MAGRGEYSAIYTAIVDDLEYQELHPDAKLCLLTLKLILGPSGIDVVRCLEVQLSEVTGLDETEVRDALDELVGGDWIRRQANVVWLKNGLRHNPNLKLANEKHKTSVVRHLAGLPKLAIVNAYAEYYALDPPWPGMGTEWLSVPYGYQVEGSRYTVEGTSSSLRSEEEAPPRCTEQQNPKATFCAEAAPLIREHWWRGKDPPAGLDDGRRWHLGRELDIAWTWATDGTADPETVLALLRHRHTAGIRDGPATLKWLNGRDRRHRLHEALAEARRVLERENAPKRTAGPRGLAEILEGARRGEQAVA